MEVMILSDSKYLEAPLPQESKYLVRGMLIDNLIG